VFRDLAASDNDAGVNKNIDFAIVAGNADIVSYACFYVILLLITSDMHKCYLQSNQSHMTVYCIYNYDFFAQNNNLLKYLTILNSCHEKKV
jgi:hypothetical protein